MDQSIDGHIATYILLFIVCIFYINIYTESTYDVYIYIYDLTIYIYRGTVSRPSRTRCLHGRRFHLILQPNLDCCLLMLASEFLFLKPPPQRCEVRSQGSNIQTTAFVLCMLVFTVMLLNTNWVVGPFWGPYYNTAPII